MLRVGLTGGIASGKSLVAKFFMELGAYVIDYDVLSREVVRPGTEAWWRIVETFGKEILRRDLTIDRKKLGDIVFADHSKLRKLEEIVHPAISEEGERRLAALEKLDPEAIVILDIPLLIEKMLASSPTAEKLKLDKIIVVYVSEETQLRRLCERDGISEEEARRRIRAQLPLKEKLKYADFVIDNEGSIEDTRRQVVSIYRRLKRCSPAREHDLA
ncbi:MAG: Dephospho-CoA kinase [Candidatus Alkanophagales archaeon MCA70_species_1]|nr:Dephospho-CoA kinase [Candidatus Alkanophaga volatiphilum]